MHALTHVLTPALLGVLLVLSAFFSGAETAMFSLSRARIRRLRDSGTTYGRLIAGLLRLPRRLLITILVGNLLVNTALTSVLTIMVTRTWGAGALPVSIAVSTALLLVFGEVTPKTFAIMRPLGFARVAALPLSAFAVLFTPVRVVLRMATNLLLDILRQGHVRSDALLTQEEYHATLRSVKVQGGLDPDEAEIIHAISSFRMTVAREIMVPRPEMVCVDDAMSLRDALTVARRQHHPRLPVFHDNIDHVWGVLYVTAVPAWRHIVAFDQPLTELAATLEAERTLAARPLLTDAFVVPESRRIDSLLSEMRARGHDLAVLLDEYGGTAGMVSRENILDTLLGGLIGTSQRRSFVEMQGDGSVVASGAVRLEQLGWECGLNFGEEPDDTLAGYVMRLLGALPVPGQSVHDALYTYTVLQMSDQRIDAIGIRPRT
jgi:CBS domain containing-hemolysin-like protein